MKTLTIDADAYARLVDSHGRLVRAAKGFSYAVIHYTQVIDNSTATAAFYKAHKEVSDATVAAERIKDA